MSVKVILPFEYTPYIPRFQTWSSLFYKEPRGVKIKVFDAFFRWGHPNTDFGLKALDEYLAEHKLKIVNKRWTPLLTMVHIEK